MFIIEVNENRLAAGKAGERKHGHFVRTDRMGIADEEPVPVYIMCR
jgi:hypothetical protein